MRKWPFLYTNSVSQSHVVIWHHDIISFESLETFAYRVTLFFIKRVLHKSTKRAGSRPCIITFFLLKVVLNTIYDISDNNYVILAIRGLRNHHRGRGLCEQIEPSQRALAQGLGYLLAKPKTKVDGSYSNTISLAKLLTLSLQNFKLAPFGQFLMKHFEKFVRCA